MSVRGVLGMSNGCHTGSPDATGRPHRGPDVILIVILPGIQFFEGLTQLPNQFRIGQDGDCFDEGVVVIGAEENGGADPVPRNVEALVGGGGPLDNLGKLSPGSS